MHLSAVTHEPQDDSPARSRLYVFFLAAVAAVSGFLFGFDTAVINGVLLFLQRQFALSSVETEIAASGSSPIRSAAGRLPSLPPRSGWEPWR